MFQLFEGFYALLTIVFPNKTGINALLFLNISSHICTSTRRLPQTQVGRVVAPRAREMEEAEPACSGVRTPERGSHSSARSAGLPCWTPSSRRPFLIRFLYLPKRSLLIIYLEEFLGFSFSIPVVRTSVLAPVNVAQTMVAAEEEGPAAFLPQRSGHGVPAAVSRPRHSLYT